MRGHFALVILVWICNWIPKHARSRRERLMVSANELVTQIFYVPPHKLHQFLKETSLHFSDSRRCFIAREMTICTKRYLDKLFNQYVTIVCSLTSILALGEVILQAICTRYGLTIGAKFIWLVGVVMIIFYPIAWD
ncbi:uncharacterized protein LOC126709148 [Quercus robur]|uniref:uncharacterized protein LOC126709148 n=1 Tax=Quercus robur TaxID=38942 RepID=UPI002161EFB7|nr:uncharacterized protein LOC126709148 [Quercus robur]XP_050265216.1 uncharacterized protein LOC126709148 [Quercus robur]